MPEPEETVATGDPQTEQTPAASVGESADGAAADAPAGDGAASEPVDSTPEAVADDVLLASTELAQRALLEVTAPESVGSVIGHVVEGEHVLTLHFAADVPGYPGWHWSVTLARVEGAEPTVLETELMPGDRALLAPEWVPWSERLAEYRAAQAAAARSAATDDDAVLGGADADDAEFEGDGSDPADADEGDDLDDDPDFDRDDDADEFGGIDIDVLGESDDPFEVGDPIAVGADDEGDVDERDVDADEPDAEGGPDADDEPDTDNEA